mgnify:CR=1 FL=1
MCGLVGGGGAKGAKVCELGIGDVWWVGSGGWWVGGGGAVCVQCIRQWACVSVAWWRCTVSECTGHVGGASHCPLSRLCPLWL